jgi:hypothetical protein
MRQITAFSFVSFSEYKPCLHVDIITVSDFVKASRHQETTARQEQNGEATPPCRPGRIVALLRRLELDLTDHSPSFLHGMSSCKVVGYRGSLRPALIVASTILIVGREEGTKIMDGFAPRSNSQTHFQTRTSEPCSILPLVPLCSYIAPKKAVTRWLVRALLRCWREVCFLYQQPKRATAVQ